MLNFIFFGLQAWDISIGSTAKNIALEISKKHNVLYINPPLTRSEWLFKRKDERIKERLDVLAKRRAPIEQINDHLWVLTPRCIAESINKIRPHWFYRIFNRLNDLRLSSEIRKAAIFLGFDELIIFDDNSMLSGFYLKEILKPRLFIYLLRDNVIAVDYHKLHGTLMQEEIVAKADLVFCNSEYFAEYCKKFNRHTYMIGQGCDISLYSDRENIKPIAYELKDITHPIIGYTGSLTSLRLDINLIYEFASQSPQWQFVFVGPEDNAFKASDLHKLTNIHFLGLKPVDRLPEFIKGFDVAINPQAINIITNWNYPLKIDEYLALGKPVVATRTVFMSYFNGFVYLAQGTNEYIEQIDRALSEDTTNRHDARIAYASEHTWTNFVGKIYEQINPIVNHE